MSYPFPDYHEELPRLSIEQMIEVDRLMVEHYYIDLVQMMENAGRSLAILAMRRFLHEEHAGAKRITILAGTGGNGGGALVCARRLANCEVDVYLINPNQMSPVAGHQMDILKRMGLEIKATDELPDTTRSNLIIDGNIGYSLKGDPTGPANTMIHWANAQTTPILSLDTPSGIDLNSGIVHDPAIQADATLTLALPKEGLYQHAVKPLRGELYLGDISVPPSLYKHLSLSLDGHTIFQNGDIARID